MTNHDFGNSSNAHSPSSSPYWYSTAVLSPGFSLGPTLSWWSNRREPFFVQQSPLFPALLDPLSCHNSWKSRSGSQSLPDLLQLTLRMHNDVCHSLIVQFLRQ